MRRTALSVILVSAGWFAAGSRVHSQPPPQTSAAKRAVVIANSAYRNLPPVPQALEQSKEITQALRKLGFVVTEVSDTPIADLSKELEEFLGTLQKGDTAILYYNGYGLQSGQENYIVPVDFPAGDADVYATAYALKRIESEMVDRGTAMRILILDAARENPTLAGRYGEGLAMPKPELRSLIVMSQRPDQVARGDTGLFTRRLVEALAVPGLTPELVFQRVKRAVSQDSGDAQTPVFVNEIVQESYLTGAPPPPPPPKPVKAELTPGATRRNRIDKQEYVWVPPGEFQMGCVPVDADCQKDEYPRHEVKITRGFWMGANEVDVAAYKTYVKLTAKSLKTKMPPAPSLSNKGWHDEAHPICNVTWEEAGAFCQWAGGRLPTEAEWEHAARAGLDGRIYPWGNEVSRENANSYGMGEHDIWEWTSPVRRFEPNKWNLFDIAGNVWEWCSDWYDPEYYTGSASSDPRGPESGRRHVRRGGSWSSGAKEMRISIRGSFDQRDNRTGFRCIIEKLEE